ncbi:hypothetical protein SADUNF_Sadunf14G0125200 [Salix dunnii]|uniref:NAC domain-containing protein n=1 Tax=Salix dunnii TaxID=1413687 RepID=A0A835JJH9_9ROSI|nr:hypothetical protein SADUNF_Sadunf14G0125200 [Salix dunnii]
MSLHSSIVPPNPETLTPHELPHGYRFRPNDEELVRFYLYPKITNPNLFTTIHTPIRDTHIFGDQAKEPWQIWKSFPKRHGEDLFFFTQLTKKGRTFVRKISRGPGTWHQVFKDPPFSLSIDPDCNVSVITKHFTYRNPKSDQNGSWIMFEYSLPSLSEQTVLCRLRKKEVHSTETVQTTTTATTKKRKRDAESEIADDATITMSQNPRMDELDQQQQIMGLYVAVENQQQHLELEPVFDNMAEFDRVQCFSFENVQDLEDYLMADDSDITSTSNVAPAPIVCAFNPIENLQSIEVEGVENDGESASTEDDNFCFDIIDFSGGYDEADGVLASQATPNLDGSCTSDAVDNGLEHGVCDSILHGWSGSFS